MTLPVSEIALEDLAGDIQVINIYCMQVVMEPGDILYIPKHWWHFVVCLDTAVSVNTWIELVCVALADYV